MANIGGVLNIGRNALLTQQNAIDVTGNNIANVNTPGYSRQRVNMLQAAPIQSGTAVFNTGVYTDKKIERLHDQFLAAQISDEQQNLGRWESQTKALERVEIVFDETTGYGLNQAMSDYWNAWQDLVNNPAGHLERMSLAAKSEYLATTFQSIDANLSQVQNDLDKSIQGALDQINRIAADIANLNVQITSAEVGGYSANDLQDKRDLLLSQLSELINVDSFYDGDGNLTISVGSGQPLVESGNSWSLTTNLNGAGHRDVFWVASDGTQTDITSDIGGGKIKGWLEVRDVNIVDYAGRLDDLAANLITAVNGLHATGLDLNGALGQAFFIGTDAGSIALNPNIAADVNLIAAAGPTEGVPGGSGTAVAIAGLQNDFTMSGNTTTFDDFYNSLVSDVGGAVQASTVRMNHQSELMNLLDSYREEISGVNLDEEMINLVKFQHAYDAAANLISTVDEMMATIIDMVR
jgi:flagellar hook-associated protein 1 FlgK